MRIFSNMTESEFTAKLEALPTNLQAEVADFIDFLVQKAAKSNSTDSILNAEKSEPAIQITSDKPQERSMEH